MPNAGDPIKDTVRKNPTFFVRRMIGICIDRWGRKPGAVRVWSAQFGDNFSHRQYVLVAPSIPTDGTGALGSEPGVASPHLCRVRFYFLIHEMMIGRPRRDQLRFGAALLAIIGRVLRHCACSTGNDRSLFINS